jgi:protein-S-isoprenylcysteine O-methyltransferase Ste14
MYVTEVVLLLGLSLMSASWVLLVFPIIIGVDAVHFIKMEEAQTLGHYGAPYGEYMKRTPRWIGIPQSRKNTEVINANIAKLTY